MLPSVVRSPFTRLLKTAQNLQKDRSPDSRLEQEVAAPLDPDARFQERLERVALSPETVDDLGACHIAMRQHIGGEGKEKQKEGNKRLGAPGLTSGALSMYESRERTG